MINVKTKSQADLGLGVQEIRERIKFQITSRMSRGSTGVITLALPKPGKVSADGGGIERAEVVVRRAGRMTFEVKLNRRAREVIKDGRRIRAHIRLSYEPQDGYPITKTFPLTFGQKPGQQRG
jgi:hypothetical protein